MALLNPLAWLDIRSLLVLALVFIIVVYYSQRPRNLPPGPWRLPFVGYLPQLMWIMYKEEPLHLFVTRLSEKYGKIYSFDICGVVFVVINDFTLMREANNSPYLNNKGYSSNKLFEKCLGKTLHSYKHNAEYRKFAAVTLRGLGIGKRSFEADIVEESEALRSELEALEGKTCDPKQYLDNTAANILFKSIFGKRHGYDNDKFLTLLNLSTEILLLMGSGGWSILLPRSFENQNTKDMLKINDKLQAFIDTLLAEHRERFDPENPSDFIDLYLKEIESNPAPHDPSSYLQEDNMRNALVMLFMAGGDTTSNVLRWCILYILGHPEVQRKVHEELDSVVDRNKLPQLSDEKRLPYFKAVVSEVMRISPTTPLSDFKSSCEEVNVGGYTIPKGATVVANIHAVQYNPDVFPEPEQFKPERFLNENGEYVEKRDLIPFGIGRRSCPGESIGRKELFIMLSHLLHRFTLVKPEDSPPITYDGDHGSVSCAKPFTVRFVPRD